MKLKRLRLALTWQLLLLPFLLSCPTSSWTQTVVSTVSVGTNPIAIAVNPTTNKIYVANCPPPSGDKGGQGTPGTVTVIDGLTNTTTTVPSGICPTAVAVNPVTNKVYVANFGHTSITCGSCFNYGSITIIDGATNTATEISDPNAKYPAAIAVNTVTNEVYVGNAGTGNVTVIDGNSYSTTTIVDPSVMEKLLSPFAIAINQTTNKIYVANNNSMWGVKDRGSVTVFDGNTNAPTTLRDPNAITPGAVAVNEKTNKIYVANEGTSYVSQNQGNITVIDGATNSMTTLTDPSAQVPLAVALNQTTNKIYVANANDAALTSNGGVTIIDGATNTVSNVKDLNAIYPHAVAMDSVTNTIFVANRGCAFLNGCSNPGSVTIINGTTGTATTIVDPKATNPMAVAVNTATGKIYVANSLSNNVTVIDGGASATSHSLSVLLAGSGTGTVTSSPSGIDCGSACSATFAAGTPVSITASPAAGSEFAGWSGVCTGTTTCDLTMSSDDSVTATFNTIPSDFSLQPASASLTAQRGGQVADTITVAPLNGSSFTSAIQLSCAVTGSTPVATCAVSPNSVTPGANSATSTLTVTAPAQTARQIFYGPRELSRPVYAVCLPTVLLGFCLALPKRRQRKRQLLFFCSCLLALVGLQTGCGGGTITPPPPLNYTVTVTATSGTIQHTTQVAVTVQ